MHDSRPEKDKPGRPPQRPDKLHVDKGYDYASCCRALAECGIEPQFARRDVESSERLGRSRWVHTRVNPGTVSTRDFWVRVIGGKAYNSDDFHLEMGACYSDEWR